MTTSTMDVPRLADQFCFPLSREEPVQLRDQLNRALDGMHDQNEED